MTDRIRPPVMIGQTLGHYQITGKLGAGGMGVVYRARDTKLGREVALKVLPTAEAGDATARERLVQEARTASALNHPHLCTIFEVGEAGGVTFAAMELVEGRPLGAQIPAEGLPTELALRYGAQIADALAHAHERGVIHRDLKTANVMVTPDGRAKVLDFGLARRVAAEEVDQATRSRVSLAEAGGVAGTLHYLAPETLRGAPADARSDIWALGVVLYQMCAGRLPYDGKSGYDVSSAILRDPLPALPPRVPAGLRAVIQRCLAREPGQRYQRAGEIRAALEAIGSSDSGISPAVGASAIPARRWWRRKLLWAGVAMAVLVGLALWKGPFLASIGKTEMPPAGPRTSSGAPASQNAEANEYFEKGLHFLTVQDDLARGQQMFERAISLDPQFAEARGWLGFTHLLQIDVGYSNDGTWVYKAEEETRRALAINPRSSRARVSLAAIQFYRGRMEVVKPELEQTIADDPEFFDGTLWLANYYAFKGESQKAKDLLLPLLARNPLLFPVRATLAEALREQGETAAAIREYDKVMEQDPQSLNLTGLARAHLDAGNTTAARGALERVRPSDHGNFIYRLVWALLLAKEGQRSEAFRWMDPEVQKYAALVPYRAYYVADFYAMLGESDKAVEWLDRAVRNGDERAEWFQRDPLLASVREHPRFKQIIESIQFQRQQRQKKSS